MSIIEKLKAGEVIPVKPKKSTIYEFGEKRRCIVDIYKNQIWYASIEDDMIVLHKSVVGNRIANVKMFISIDLFLSDWEEKIYKN